MKYENLLLTQKVFLKKPKNRKQTINFQCEASQLKNEWKIEGHDHYYTSCYSVLDLLCVTFNHFPANLGKNQAFFIYLHQDFKVLVPKELFCIFEIFKHMTLNTNLE